MTKLLPGTKVRIKPTYCLKKRHGEIHEIVTYTNVFGGKYSLKGQDWLIDPKDVEPA
jgi:hypothetical protein